MKKATILKGSAINMCISIYHFSHIFHKHLLMTDRTPSVSSGFVWIAGKKTPAVYRHSLEARADDTRVLLSIKSGWFNGWDAKSSYWPEVDMLAPFGDISD